MAAPLKNSGPTPDDIMAAAEMKPLLALSKREPVNAALGMTGDKLGVVLLHKKMKPKKVAAELKSKAKKAQLNIEASSVRFGTAEVDPEIDSALVRFRINKEAPSLLAPKVRDHLKKAGFARVEFIVDPKLEDEAEEGETAGEAGAGEAGAGEAGAEARSAIQAEAEPDWPGKTAELMGLAKQIAGASAGDPTRQQPLVQLAGVANASLKAREDFAAASAAVSALREALGGGDGGASRGGGSAVKAMPVWQAAKDAVDDQLRALSDTLRQTGIAELDDVSDEVESLLELVRVKLAVALLNYDADPAKPTTRAAALAAIAGASDWLGTDERVKAVDTNPFGVPVSAGVTLGAALRQLQGTLAGTREAAA